MKYTVPQKRVLLYSGGLDSLILAHLLDPDVLLYVDARTAYSGKEVRALVQQEWAIPKLRVDDSLHLGSWELENSIVPMRNLLLASVAARYGNEILFGFTAGDRSRDKDEIFASLTSAMLSRLHEEQWWCEPTAVTVCAPRKASTKGELVREYLGRGFDPERLVTCISCYNPYTDQCGRCKCCVRKYVALAEAGIDLSSRIEAFREVRETEEFHALVRGSRGREGAGLVT